MPDKASEAPTFSMGQFPQSSSLYPIIDDISSCGLKRANLTQEVLTVVNATLCLHVSLTSYKYEFFVNQPLNTIFVTTFKLISIEIVLIRMIKKDSRIFDNIFFEFRSETRSSFHFSFYFLRLQSLICHYQVTISLSYLVVKYVSCVLRFVSINVLVWV